MKNNSVSNNSGHHTKTVQFQAIQFSISTQFSSIWLIDRILSGASTPGQSGPGSDGKEVALCISQSSGITGTSPSDCLVSYPGHSLGGWWGLTPLHRCRRCILLPQPTVQGETRTDVYERQWYYRSLNHIRQLILYLIAWSVGLMFVIAFSY